VLLGREELGSLVGAGLDQEDGHSVSLVDLLIFRDKGLVQWQNKVDSVSKISFWFSWTSNEHLHNFDSKSVFSGQLPTAKTP